MSSARFLTAFLLLLALPVPLHAAPDFNDPACTDETYARFAQEQRMYRSVVYGSKKAADLPINSKLFDTSGTLYVKKATNSWVAVSATSSGSSAGGSSDTRSDSTMDEAKDTPTRRGILEAKRSLTSDLIPALTQSLRAFQCRLQAVCAGAYQSHVAKEDQKTLQVQPDGCIQFDVPVLTSCIMPPDVGVTSVSLDTCNFAADAVFKQESTLLDLSVANDASYRTIAQFAGMFEGFLTQFRFPLLTPLWQTVRVLGGLKNIPCFLAQCDE